MRKHSEDKTIHIAEDSQLAELAILCHGYSKFMRDYDVYVANYSNSVRSGYRLYRFYGCVFAQTRLLVDESEILLSLQGRDEIYDSSAIPVGEFDWRTGFSTSHYGIRLLDDSELKEWRSRLGCNLYKANISTETYDINLIFFSLGVSSAANPPKMD